MGARDVLAEAVWRAVWSSHSPWSEADDAERADVHEEADALLAAIRAMTPREQAELIGGEVQGGYHWGGRFYPSGADDEIDAVRIVTPWREGEVRDV